MMDKQYAIAVMTIILGLGINQAGNFSGIDSGINRSLQDKPPSFKFRTDDKDFNYRNNGT